MHGYKMQFRMALSPDMKRASAHSAQVKCVEIVEDMLIAQEAKAS
jgi:hypothetical protein